MLARAAGVPAPDTPERMRRLLKVGLTETSMRKTGADLDVALSLVDDYPADWDHLMLIVVEAMRRSSGLATIAVKTPSIESDMLHVHDFFTANGWDVRWIYSVRHPFDAYLSYRKIASEWSRALAHMDVLRWAGRWIDSGAEALQGLAALGPDRFRIQRFEDLLADPVGACRCICEWLDLEDAAEEMTLAQGRDSNTSFRNQGTLKTTGAVQDLRDRPRVGLSRAEEESLRIVCAGPGRAFGYDLGPVPPRAELPRHMHQSLRMAQLSARNYAHFVPRELFRRAVRVCRTAYSTATGRPTVSSGF